MIRVGERWLADFASCNHLGLDLEPEIIDAVPAYLDRWGTHPSWSRLLGSPRPYVDIEDRLTALLGAEDTLVLPTITHIRMSVIPVLADGGTILLDRRAHKTIYDGCTVARAHGATIHRFDHGDLCQLESLLRLPSAHPPVICTDGANSMTGNAPDLAAFARWRASTTRCCTSPTRTASASSASAPTTSCATTARAGTRSCAIS